MGMVTPLPWTQLDSTRRGAPPVSRSPQGRSFLPLFTRSRWASRSFCMKSLRASCTEATSMSGPCCPGAGEGHRSGERDLAGGLALCRPERPWEPSTPVGQ